MPSDFAAGKMSIDFPYDGSYDGVYQERQYGSAQALYDSVGVTRADKVERQEIFMRNFAFFGAPHVAFFFLPEPFGLREAADVGMFAQTFMLSLTAHGMGSCPQTSLSFQADLVRERLDIPSNQKLLFGISFGYPERDAPINACATDRAALGDLVTFHN
jgi:nitroreductase